MIRIEIYRLNLPLEAIWANEDLLKLIYVDQQKKIQKLVKMNLVYIFWRMKTLNL